MNACGFREKEPQINADECGIGDNLHANCMQIARKNYKAQPQFRTRMTRIGRIFTDTANPRASAQSVFHQVCSFLKNPASGASVSAFIGVHLRFFKNVVFQTGLTGSTGCVFNPVHPIILSNLKCQLTAPEQIVKLLGGVE